MQLYIKSTNDRKIWENDEDHKSIIINNNNNMQKHPKTQDASQEKKMKL